LDKKEIKDAVLEVLIDSTEAQLRALRRLRGQGPEPRRRRKSRSNLDLVEDILRTAGLPLHIREILERVARVHGVELDRESLVSQITKQVLRRRRFVRTAPNTFALLDEEVAS
jgi:hypothetical protein